jgi:bla regulator protein BlaR1
MRRLTFAAIALAFASTLLADGNTCASGKARVFADDHITFANGLSSEKLETLRAKYGKTFLYVERDDKSYLVTDSETLDRVRHIVFPQSQLGQQQASLGTKQAAIGTKQASVGLEQGRIGAQQAFASDAERRRLESRQEELSKRQEELSRQQEELSKQQQALGAKQESLQKQSDAQIDTVLDQAIAAGLARQVK